MTKSYINLYIVIYIRESYIKMKRYINSRKETAMDDPFTLSFGKVFGIQGPVEAKRGYRYK